MGKKVVFFSDMHINAEINGVLNKERFDAVIQYCLENKPAAVINGGDSIDSQILGMQWNKEGADALKAAEENPDELYKKVSEKIKSDLESNDDYKKLKDDEKGAILKQNVGRIYLGSWLSNKFQRDLRSEILSHYHHVSKAVAQLDRAGIKYGYVDGNHDFVRHGSLWAPHYPMGKYLAGEDPVELAGLVIKGATNSIEVPSLIQLLLQILPDPLARERTFIKYDLGNVKIDFDREKASIVAQLEANGLSGDNLTAALEEQRKDICSGNEERDQELGRLRKGCKPNILVYHKSYRLPFDVLHCDGNVSGWPAHEYIRDLRAEMLEAKKTNKDAMMPVILSGHWHLRQPEVVFNSHGLEVLVTPTSFAEIDFDDEGIVTNCDTYEL